MEFPRKKQIVSLAICRHFMLPFMQLLCLFLVGFARTLGVHSVAYFYFVMAFLGIVNSTGWPGVVPTLNNWLGKSGFGTLFGKSTRGLTMGVWNTHQYVGNIIGLSVA